mgnify:CR=1 FL=1
MNDLMFFLKAGYETELKDLLSYKEEWTEKDIYRVEFINELLNQLIFFSEKEYEK